ncbi:MAG: hypothetical protein Greene071436_337 [Parcubacteria group bacterium Greene0714_36]|nr:MAG: hypothetical protein Greene071436_337 [Parcubacteria group bacterium Greene0714_36]
MFSIEIDKKGLLYTLELLAVAVVIAASAHFAAREIVAWSAPAAPEDVSFSELPAVPDENSFYIDPPAGVPAFLTRDEIKKKREALVWEKRDFLFVDMDQRVVSRYGGGTAQSEFPLIAPAGGEPFFEAPQGLYTVQGKAERHFSQIGRRYFPWAIYLYGNYLIHAESQGKSGGIQVAPNHARDLFAHATEGMPVLVSREDSPAEVVFTYVRKKRIPPHRLQNL